MSNQSNNRIRVLAVEDDPIFSETISMTIEEAGFDLIGVLNNVDEAIQWVKIHRPDIILVDIYLAGEKTGIDLMKALDPSIPVIVITSIRDSIVFEEIQKLRPFTFLLKPFDSLVLSNNVKLAIAKQVGKREDVWDKEDFMLGQSFFIREKKSLFKVHLNEILYIHSEDKYCTLFTKKRKYVLRIQLKNLLNKIPENFIQVHRSYVIDINQIDQIQLDDLILIINNSNIPIGMTYQQSLLNKLQTL